MRRLFLSDLHLDDASGLPLRALDGLLRSQPSDEVYLLGDLCEMWIGDDDDSLLTERLTAVLQAAATRERRLFFLAGNRDFLLGDIYAGRIPMTRLEEPHLLADGSLLCHGDTLCVDDAAYQEMRTVLRSAAWQEDVLARSLDERRELGASLRAASRRDNANKPQNIMDVNSEAVGELAARHGAKRLIHGHTHRPGRHDHPCERIVLGAWERCAWWLLTEDEDTRLQCAGLAQLAAQCDPLLFAESDAG